MNSHDFRRRADRVRVVPLETVLTLRGATRDRHDRAKWHTEQGPLSVTGVKFTSWHSCRGGGGAIDLVMHLAGVGYRTAVGWLEQHAVPSHLTAGDPVPAASVRQRSADGRPRPLRLPVPDDRLLDRVRRYLTGGRGLRASLLEPLIASGKLYADRRANGVFVLVAGKAERPVGAELRGTGSQVWRGMAAGTNKDLGYFWIGAQGSREIVLCESAIDAISCFQLYPERICISTSGVRANPPWLRVLIDYGYALFCGFDADDPGDAGAAAMLAHHPAVQRLRPSAHDWNDVLTSRQ